jgi:hypothetical protein
VQPRNADELQTKELLSLALDWIEAQAATEHPATATRFNHLLAECEPICRAACLPRHREQAIELLGPAGNYPLAIGLSLLAAGCGKPWGFIAQPQTWNEDDWRKVTDAVANLCDRPICYRSGFKKVGLTFPLAA